MNRMLTIWMVLCICCFGWEGRAQESLRVVFYNTENLFDTRNDTLTADDEFTPQGKKHWTQARYIGKLRKIATVLTGTGEGEYPALIGLAEIENRKVLEDLCHKTSLTEGNYGIVHQDSPDRRGIDVALLYRQEQFRLLATDFLRISFPEDTTLRTRDILYASGVVQGDTLHIFVCHFPSMLGGEKQSEWKRIRAAEMLRRKTDSLFRLSPETKIMIMGDLNGKAGTPAQQRLGCRSSDDTLKSPGLYNTGYYLLRKGYGSYRYQGRWQTIDHIIASGGLLQARKGWKAGRHLSVYNPVYLMEKDEGHYGYKPWPTYRGLRYCGGYSDHLPVFLDLRFLP